MTALLNIALLVIGTTATLAAFGGVTCRDGSEPLPQRVTLRGWISLACLLLALVIGTVKEIATQRDDARSEASVSSERAEATRRQAEQSLQLAESNSKLALARKSLDDLRQIDQITQDRLSDTRTTLNEVRSNLSDTRADLTQQSAANQVTGLANAGQNVKEMVVILPLTARARTSTRFREAFLPVFDLNACRDLTGVEFRFSTNERNVEEIVHASDDEANEHDEFAQPVQKADFLVSSSNPVPGVAEAIKRSAQMAGQDSSNGYLYTAVLNTLEQGVSAARLYAALTKPGAAPFSIAMSWPAIFTTRRAYQDALKTYPDILEDSSGEALPQERIELNIAKQHPYPPACAKGVQHYFQTAFDRAFLELILDYKQNEVIVFKLQALAPRLSDGKWEVLFRVTSPPMPTAVDDALLKQFSEIWPAESGPRSVPK